MLVYLSNEYTAAATIERRNAYATVADGLIAENNTPNLILVLTTVGILLMSAVMLKGVFPAGSRTWASQPAASASSARH